MELLLLGAAGPQSCDFAPLPLPSCSPGEERGSLHPLLWSTLPQTTACSHARNVSQLLVSHTGPADRWESFPQHVLPAVSAAVQGLCRGKASPAQQLHVLQSILLCSHRVGFLFHIHRHLPASSLQNHFPHILFPRFITSCCSAQEFHRVVEFEGTLKIVQFHTPALGRDTFHLPSSVFLPAPCSGLAEINSWMLLQHIYQLIFFFPSPPSSPLYCVW